MLPTAEMWIGVYISAVLLAIMSKANQSRAMIDSMRPCVVSPSTGWQPGQVLNGASSNFDEVGMEFQTIAGGKSTCTLRTTMKTTFAEVDAALLTRGKDPCLYRALQTGTLTDSDIAIGNWNLSNMLHLRGVYAVSQALIGGKPTPVIELVSLYWDARQQALNYCCTTISTLKNVIVPTALSSRDTDRALRAQLLLRLPIVQFPCPALNGKQDVLYWMANPDSIDDSALVHSLVVFRKAMRQDNRAGFGVEKLTRDRLNLSLSMLPSHCRRFVMHLLCGAIADGDVKDQLGLTKNVESALKESMGKIYTEIGAKVKEWQKTNFGDARVSNFLRKQAPQLMKNSALAFARSQNSVRARHPGVIKHLQEAAEAMGASNKRFGAGGSIDTPVNNFILSAHWDEVKSKARGEGGCIEELTRRANIALSKSCSCSPTTCQLTNSCTQRLLPEADIVFASLQNRYTAPKVAQHWAAYHVKGAKYFDACNSGDCMYLSIDSKSLVRIGSMHQNHVETSAMQLIYDRLYGTDHDAGRERGKVRLFTVMMRGTVPETYFTAYPELDPKVVFSEDWKVPTERRQQFTTALGYDNAREPETSARNFQAILESMESNPEHFYVPGTEIIKSACVIELDNAHGVQELEARFCSCILFKLLNLNIFFMVSNSGGHSWLHMVERAQGALSVRLNKQIFEYPGGLKVSKAEHEVNMGVAVCNVCATADGATFSDDVIHVFPAGLYKEHLDFSFDPIEVPAFLACKTDVQRAAFVCRPQKGAFVDTARVLELYLQAYSLLQSTDVQVKEHSMCITTDPATTNYRSPIVKEFVVKLRTHCGGHLPSPVLSTDPSKQGDLPNGVGPRYADWGELFSRIEGGDALAIAGAKDRTTYPDKVLDRYLATHRTLMSDFIAANNILSIEHLHALMKALAADRSTVLYEIKRRAEGLTLNAEIDALDSANVASGVDWAVLEYVKTKHPNPLGPAKRPTTTQLLACIKKDTGKEDKSGDRVALLVQKIFDLQPNYFLGKIAERAQAGAVVPPAAPNAQELELRRLQGEQEAAEAAATAAEAAAAAAAIQADAVALDVEAAVEEPQPVEAPPLPPVPAEEGGPLRIHLVELAAKARKAAAVVVAQEDEGERRIAALSGLVPHEEDAGDKRKRSRPPASRPAAAAHHVQQSIREKLLAVDFSEITTATALEYTEELTRLIDHFYRSDYAEHKALKALRVKFKEDVREAYRQRPV